MIILKLFLSKYYKYIIIIAFTCLVSLPLFTDSLYLGHDTLFHISRIEGLATSLKHLDFIPTIYPFKNDNFGYASALFYCDILLYPFALLYLLGIDIVICYKLCIITFTFIAALTSYNFIAKIANDKYSPLIGSLLYISTTYRLSNIYVRGALGEIISYAFLPIVLMAIYKLFYANEDAKKELIIGFSLVILSHNISFILACLLFLGFIICNITKLPQHLKPILLSIISVVGITAFFTFPMLEQLADQNFYLEQNTSLFYTSNITFNQLFVNKLNFNTAGQTNNSLTITPGIFILITGYLSLLFKPNKFIKHSLLITTIFIILALGIIPLPLLKPLETIQFIWRFMMIVCILLTLPSTYFIFQLPLNKTILLSSTLILLTLNTTILLLPCFNNHNTINNNTKYSSLLDGSIIDPYYAAFYVRVEVAGADYLPIGCIDYKNYKYAIQSQNGNIIPSTIKTNYNLEFTIPSIEESVIIPKTYYKGYQVYSIENNTKTKLPTCQDNKTKLVKFDPLNTSGNYILTYNHTNIQIISYIITITTLITLITKYRFHKK